MLEPETDAPLGSYVGQVPPPQPMSPSRLKVPGRGDQRSTSSGSTRKSNMPVCTVSLGAPIGWPEIQNHSAEASSETPSQRLKKYAPLKWRTLGLTPWNFSSMPSVWSELRPAAP